MLILESLLSLLTHEERNTDYNENYLRNTYVMTSTNRLNIHKMFKVVKNSYFVESSKLNEHHYRLKKNVQKRNYPTIINSTLHSIFKKVTLKAREPFKKAAIILLSY